MVSNTSQHRIIHPSVVQPASAVYNASSIPPSLVTQNSSQSKFIGGLHSASSPQLSTGSPFPPPQLSNLTVASSSHQVAPLQTGSHPVSYSQEVVSHNVASQNIPSHFNQSNQQQRLGTSHLHPQNSEPSSDQQKFDGRLGPPQHLPTRVSSAPYMQISPSITNGPPLQQQQPLSQQDKGIPHQNMQGQNSTVSPHVPRTNAQSFVLSQQVKRPTGQSGPAFGMPPVPGSLVGSHLAHQPLQPPLMDLHMTQPGILSPEGNSQTQPGMPSVTGDVQKPPPSMGYPQLPMPNQFPAPPQPGASQHEGSLHLGKRYPQQVS